MMRAGLVQGRRGAHAAISTSMVAIAVTACAPAPEVALVSFPAPQALVSCAALPDDLDAELWVSGNDEACDLEPGDDGSVSGSCENFVAGRAVRTVTLDWFIVRGGVRVLLAQAQKEVDLTAVSSGEQTVAFTEDDIRVRGCFDMRDDQLDGSPTMLVNGAQRLVCDLDEDCPADLAVTDCSNLGEVCAGADPLQ